MTIVKHKKRKPSISERWERFCDQVYTNEKLRNRWNNVVCPVIEMVCLGLLTIITVLALYVWIVTLILIFG